MKFNCASNLHRSKHTHGNQKTKFKSSESKYYSSTYYHSITQGTVAYIIYYDVQYNYLQMYFIKAIVQEYKKIT